MSKILTDINPITNEKEWDEESGTFKTFERDLTPEELDEITNAALPVATCTQLQMRRILRQMNLFDTVEAIIDTQPSETQDAWHYASVIRSDSETLLILAENLTPPLYAEQVRELVVAASQLPDL